MTMHSLHHGLLLDATTYVGLVCSYDENVSCFLQSGASFDDPVIQPEIFKRGWWVGFTITNNLHIQGAIAIEKHSRTQNHGDKQMIQPHQIDAAESMRMWQNQV